MRAADFDFLQTQHYFPHQTLTLPVIGLCQCWIGLLGTLCPLSQSFWPETKDSLSELSVEPLQFKMAEPSEQS